MRLSKGQAGKAGASSHLTSTQLILALAQPLPPPPCVFKQKLTRLWDPSPALQLGGRETATCQVENGQNHSRKKLRFQVLRRNEEQWEALSGVSGPTFTFFHSVYDELELLHQDVCSFHLSSWAIILLVASKDAHGIPTPPLLFV